MTSDEAGTVTVPEAARHAALFAASAGVGTFIVNLALVAGDYGSLGPRALQHAEFFLTWPLWAVVAAGLAQFALTAGRTMTGWWDFAWRGAVASWVGVAAATSGVLVIVEVLSGMPGSAGGFLLVIFSVIGFTVVGGPLVAALVAALLRPRRFRRSGSRTEWERTDARRRLGYVLFFAGAAVCLGLVASAALVSSRGSLEYNCLMSGPRPTEPPLAVISEASGIVEGSFTLWPVGRQCEWDRADGRGTVTVDSGTWGTTAVAGGGALLALAGAALILTSNPRSGVPSSTSAVGARKTSSAPH